MTVRRNRRAWRAVVVGLASGPVGFLGAGCRSAEHEPATRPQASAFLYPGLRARAVPVAQPDEGGRLPVREPVAVSVFPARRVRHAAFVERAGEPTGSAAGPGVITPVVSAAVEETIDLGVALRLAGVGNPTVGLARERVREALAGQLAANSLLLPSLNIGGNYRFHSGPLQDDPGELRPTTLRSLYLGAGAGAIGSNPTAVPGVRLFAHLGDAVYEPLAAHQRVAARRADSQAVENQVLGDVAVAYLELVGAEASVDVLRRAEADVAEVARVTAAFAKAGQGTPADANRAEATADLVRRQLRQAEGDVAAASARLCRLLALDPAVRLRSPGGPVEALHLLPEEDDTLLETAVQSRPELAAQSAAVGEAGTRVRQERVRPLLPTVSVGYSAGLFGGGGSLANASFGAMNGRSDFDVVAAWNVQNFGFGNVARVRAADAGVGQTVAAYDAALNQVRREVAVAQAAALAAARQMVTARSALAAAAEGYALEAERTRRGEGRPIETLDSFRQLVDARLESLRAVIAFDTAQFRLFVAVGNSPTVGGDTSPP